ncbi:GntR family transcriptional regulator [Rouxiella chamberiensis]|uniref:GntR family transcriptional regulator n=1 Tax=Rouxiella chamberiensis TaxID=1513468 RepID=UPI000698BC46|nr:GntR family transcriptional regulator [Rouxiella chamberiensis]
MSEQKLNVSAREMVEDRIRSGIAVGDFLPGEPLREREICELTGVSRSAVREAFRSLEAEGLITTVRYRGPMVSQLSIEEVHSIYELRGILESACAQLFTQRATAEQRASLRESVEEIGRGHATQNMVLVINASEKFYQVLTEGTGNVAIGQTLFSLLNRLALFRFSSTRWPGRAEKSMAELRAIITAIEANDADTAALRAVEHTVASGEIALLVIEERQRGAQASGRGRARKTARAQG